MIINPIRLKKFVLVVCINDIFLAQKRWVFFCFLVERPSTILDVESGNSLLVVPDPFGTLEMSDANGKFRR